MKRRDFLFGTAAAIAGTVIITKLWGSQKNYECSTQEHQTHFNYFEVSGNNI